MRNISKLQRTATIIIVTFMGFASLGVNSAHALANNYVFGYSGEGVGTEQLTINGTTVIQASLTGWNDNHGNTTVGAPTPNTNYVAGTCGAALCGRDTIYNDFFNFDLSSLSGPIVSATLSLYNPGVNTSTEHSDGFTGNPATFVVHDANSVTAQLLAGTNVSTTFDAISNGTVFGSQFITSAVNGAGNGSQVQIVLNAAALSALAANEGRSYTVGGTFGALSAVPLPAGAPMFVFALLAVFGAIQYSKRRSIA